MKSQLLRTLLVVSLTTIFININLVKAQTLKALFDNTKNETAGQADWIIDSDQPVPSPAQSGITPSTAENYWLGGISAWGVDLVKKGFTVHTLTTAYGITYGNISNPYDLSNYNLFIVCEPQNPFTTAEKLAIRTFVQNGGGLMMVADHDVSDRDNDGWDSPMVWNDLGSDTYFGIHFQSSGQTDNNISQVATNIATSLTDSIIKGSAGNVTALSFHNGTTINLLTANNPSAAGHIWMNTAAQGTTKVMAATASYGLGKVAGVGDSSPADDGTGQSGNTLYTGWTEVGATDNYVFLNMCLWLTSGTPSASPRITVSPTTLPSTFFYLVGSGPSASQSYNLSGTNLTPAADSLTVTGSTNYEVSKNNSSFTGTVKVGYSGGTLSATPIYVRLKSGLAAGSYSSETISNTGGGAAQKNGTCNGIVYKLEPSNHVTTFSSVAGTPSSSTINLTWTDATGTIIPDGYLIKASTVSYAAIVDPVDGTAESNATLVKNVLAGVQSSSFTGLTGNTTYYFKIYPYTNSSTTINYKINGTLPQTSRATDSAPINPNTSKLDDFNRTNSNTVGNTPTTPTSLTWNEIETVASTAIQINSNQLQLGSATAGRDFAYVDLSLLPGYPTQLSLAGTTMTWAFNFRNTRPDPSGFDASNYGIAFILGKTTNDVTTGDGYAVVIGQSLATDPIRLARFTAGPDANANFTNIISGNDYGAEYISVKVTYNPTGNNWSLYAESNASIFPQTNPASTATQIGSTTSDNTFTTSALRYMGCFWNHSSTGTENAIFDDIYIADFSGNLPIQLASFVGNIVGNNVKLEWQTISETNNYGFNVQRLNEATNNYESIGFVAGNGSTITPQSYSYIDDQPGNSYRLEQIDNDGLKSYFGPIYINPNSVGDKSAPAVFALNQNYPNPFNPSTIINYQLAIGNFTTLKVYNLISKEVATLVNGYVTAGSHQVIFDGSKLSSGMYFYKLQSGNNVEIRKFTLVK